MSLKPQASDPIPETTARFARAAFPKGNAIMRLRDHLGPIYRDEQFRGLFPHDGQPALLPGLLALVTVLQFVEGLSDQQAADAVRARIDWKYALALELDDTGFDASVLCEFRCMKFLPSRSCGGSGSSSFTLANPVSLCAGVWRRIFLPPHS